VGESSSKRKERATGLMKGSLDVGILGKKTDAVRAAMLWKPKRLLIKGRGWQKKRVGEAQGGDRCLISLGRIVKVTK